MTDFNVLAIDLTDPEAPSLFSKSLHETGFAILKNHGLTPYEIETMYGAWSGFFQGEEKFDFPADPKTHAGYFGFKSENAKGAVKKDLKEFYHVYESGPVPPSAERETRAFHAKLITIGKTLLEWLDEKCPEEISSKFSMPLSAMIDDSPSHLLRVLHYPPLDEDVEEGEVRAAEHEDINLITLLVTGSEPGLEAKSNDGAWHAIPSAAGYITVNAGDMLALATQNYYPSTPHRVVNPPKAENRSRYSMPLFVHPREEVPLDETMTAGQY
ncbi:MAG: 2OG-Fe(II) oxygenase family protein, partial [Pseudomonadota bacterium]